MDFNGDIHMRNSFCRCRSRCRAVWTALYQYLINETTGGSTLPDFYSTSEAAEAAYGQHNGAPGSLYTFSST